jgi:hypothetical protein
MRGLGLCLAAGWICLSRIRGWGFSDSRDILSRGDTSGVVCEEAIVIVEE